MFGGAEENLHIEGLAFGTKSKTGIPSVREPGVLNSLLRLWFIKYMNTQFTAVYLDLVLARLPSSEVESTRWLKVKVKVALEQATKSQSGSTGIALFFL